MRLHVFLQDPFGSPEIFWNPVDGVIGSAINSALTGLVPGIEQAENGGLIYGPAPLRAAEQQFFWMDIHE